MLFILQVQQTIQPHQELLVKILGLFINDVRIFWGLFHPLVVMSACCHLLAYPLMLQIDDVICPKSTPSSPLRHSEAIFGRIPLNFPSFSILSDDTQSLLVIFCHTFELPLVVQCWDVIWGQPLYIFFELYLYIVLNKQPLDMQ